MTEYRRTISGVTYEAFTTLSNECTGCAATKGDSLCRALPLCSPDAREDGQNVIFIITKGSYV